MLTQERVKELFYYNDGKLIRKITRGPAKAGSVAGSVNGDGYIEIKIDGKSYGAHRLVYLYHYGKFPEGDIDHKDRIRTNNKINNLRSASRSQNKINSPANPNNKSGYKGVSWDKSMNCWIGQLMVNRKRVKIGYFDTKEEAARAYDAAVIKHFGEFAYVNFPKK